MSTTPSTFVATVDPALAKKMLADLKNQDFEISQPPHTFFSAKKKGVSCTFYQSGKLTVQGKEMGEFIEFYLEPNILKSFEFSHGSKLFDPSGRIGIDESGKGDFFGPLCVAGVYAEGDQIGRLKDIGVRDSKALNDTLILKLADKIKKECIHHIVKITPAKYNQLIVQFGNLNKLLAWGHATTIEILSEKTGCKKIIVDQFADERVVLTALKRKNLQLDVTQRHRAEEDVVVAAASILARATFVESIEQMERQYGLKFPKGASKQTIAAGKKFVSMLGRENLNAVGKVHFKTLDSIMN